VILLDPEDEWLRDYLRWRISTKGYVEATMYDGEWRKTVKMHHFITGTPIWEGEMADHINRNKLDNRRSNLRIVTKYESSQNRQFVDDAKHYRVTRNGKFEVRISIKGVTVQVGTFATIEEAEMAYENRRQAPHSGD
jgi:hypothetical protein